MKAIMLFFVRHSGTEMMALKWTILPANGETGTAAQSRALETKPEPPLLPPSTTPPYWTWFIENPRARSSAR